jgi:hypothetical protein
LILGHIIIAKVRQISEMKEQIRIAWIFDV